MSFARKLFAALGARRDRTLRPIETLVLDSLQSIVSRAAWAALREQAGAISFVYRDPTGKGVSFGFDRHQMLGKWLSPSLFDAWPIAIVYIRLPGRAMNIRASVWVATGRIQGITFSDIPTRSDAVDPTVVASELLYDPLSAHFDTTSRREAPLPEPYPAVWNEVVAMRLGAARVRAPLGASLPERFLLPARDYLPRDFADLMRYTNGFALNGWLISGLPIEEVAMERSNLFLLGASTGENVLCAMDGDRDRNVYVFNWEDQSARRLGGSFMSALYHVALK